MAFFLTVMASIGKDRQEVNELIPEFQFGFLSVGLIFDHIFGDL